MIRRMVDMHCHIMPGVDDGAKTRKEVQEMLKMEYENGVRTVILTPHYRKDMFEPDFELIKKRFQYVKYEAENMGLDMDVFLGCEYHANSDMIKEIKENPRFRINGGKYVLVEFSSTHTYQKIRDYVYQMINSGFKPIIAHIERYRSVVKNLDNVSELIDLGAYVQVSSGALLGEDGLRAMLASRAMLRKKMIHFIGSDCHDAKERCPNFKKCAEYVEKKVDIKYAKNIFVNNPKKILGYKD